MPENMTDDLTPNERVWTLVEAREVVDLQITILPELMTEFMRLSGGKVGLIDPILNAVADGVSYDPESAMTVDRFRYLAGAPMSDGQELEVWRKETYDRYQEQHRPSRPESF